MIIGVLPIPIAIIKYIKEMDLKTKLDVIEENVLFNKEILKNDTMAQFRKLVFKFSIIKNSWNTTYFIEAVISSLVGLADSDLKNQNKNEQTNLDYSIIKNKFESIDAAVHGFENSFRKGYDVEYIIKKYFNHIGAKFDEELNINYKDEQDKTVYNYPILNGHIKTLKEKVKQYYLKEIAPVLFVYEFLK